MSPSALMAVSIGTPGGHRGGGGGAPGAGDGVVLPAEEPLDQLAGLEGGVAGLDHLADGERAHHLANLHRGEVGVPGHPAALGGVDREVEVAHQRLALGRLRRRGLDEAEVLGGDEPFGRRASSHWRFTGRDTGLLLGSILAAGARGASGRVRWRGARARGGRDRSGRRRDAEREEPSSRRPPRGRPSPCPWSCPAGSGRTGGPSHARGRPRRATRRSPCCGLQTVPPTHWA